MKLLLCAVGHRMPAWVERRLRRVRSTHAARDAHRADRDPPGAAAGEGGESLRDGEDAGCRRRSHSCGHTCLRAGWSLSTSAASRSPPSQFARLLEGWRRDGRDVAFVIGSADGLDPKLKQSAALLLSLSTLTSAAPIGARVARRAVVPRRCSAAQSSISSGITRAAGPSSHLPCVAQLATPRAAEADRRELRGAAAARGPAARSGFRRDAAGR